MAAKMLCAYYDQSCNSDSLFSDLQIASDPTYLTHLNRYPVIYLDMTFFTTTCKDQDTIVEWMDRWIRNDLQKVYPEVPSAEGQPLISYLLALAQHQGKRFIMIIDEWDAICRETALSSELMHRYVDWLRSMFKSSNTDRVFAGVYMTGILPIKQYDTQSALNNFTHYSVLDPEPLQGYFGFTEEEAKALKKGTCSNYWMQTGAYEGLKRYITMNLDGLRDAVVSLLSGMSVKIESLRFSGDLRQMDERDSVLTTLIHLGYLTCKRNTKTVRIPNNEVKQEFEDVIRDSNWTYVTEAINHSERLMQDTLEGNEKAVAEAIEKAHQDNTSIIRYNDENSLSCVLSLAYYTAQKDYAAIRELPTGKGYADIVLVPRPGIHKPALVLELKWDKSARTAINQIKEKDYTSSLAGYVGEIILVAVTYDKTGKTHTCLIEKTVKTQGAVKEQSSSNQGVVKEYALSRKQKTILEYCIQPRTLEEIAAHMQVSDKYYLKRKHIDPMLGIDLLMTEPDTPTSPTQQYVTRDDMF